MKILLVTPTLRTGGGVIRSLRNMLLLVPLNNKSIDLLSLEYSSLNTDSFENSNILPGNIVLSAFSSTYLPVNSIWLTIKALFIKFIIHFTKYIGLYNFFEDLCLKVIAKKYTNYDVVIAFQEGFTTRFCSRMNISKKICWIHCDYSSFKKINLRDEQTFYDRYDKIVCVSQYTLKCFINIYPSLKIKSTYIYNLLDTDLIKRKSLLPINYSSPSKYTLISIGRIHPIKRFSAIPLIISRLKGYGITDFTWILLGSADDQNEYNLLQKELHKYNISTKNFQYLGLQQNPYPYIKNADILVSLSESEACPFVVNEAKILHVPVVSTNYPSIYEFISNGYDGSISSLEHLPEVLYSIMSSKTSLSNLKCNLQNFEYDNKNIILDINNLLFS